MKVYGLGLTGLLVGCGKIATPTFIQEVVPTQKPWLHPENPEVIPTLKPETLPENQIDQRTLNLLSIHLGAHSIDRNDLTQNEIESAIEAIVTNAPNLTHISTGTYFDYEEQIQMWVNSIHKHGKKAYIRSAGFNTWQGTFDFPSNGTPDQHQNDITDWIIRNRQIFQDGDIFEPVPDEASNGRYWFQRYGGGGVGSTVESKNEFNQFIRETVAIARQAFDEYGLQGVVVEVYHDNPSVIKDVITQETADKLKLIGTNNYPERDATNAEECALSMMEEMKRWVQGVHSDKEWVITFGPSIYSQLDEEVQKEALEAELAVIMESVVNLLGITVWQFGDESNWPTGRLFDYMLGKWLPREAVKAFADVKINP